MAEPESSAPHSGIGHFALKERRQFLVADRFGDIVGPNDGLFRDDTRVLSRFELRIGDALPSLLSSTVSADNVYFRAHLTNRPLPPLGDSVTPRGVIHIERSRFLWDARLFERIVLTNYGSGATRVPLTFAYAADFADIFEVRGHVRERRGTPLAARIGERGIVLRYEGLDRVQRTTALSFSIAPADLDDRRATFAIALDAREQCELYVGVGDDLALPSREAYRHAAACARVAMRRKLRCGASLSTAARPFRNWLDKARADLALLTAELPSGRYPFAGIPWFSTPFGRDGIITALEVLWLDPSLARGVLRFLASNQADAVVPEQDAEPGKILHEVRGGEMALLSEVPFGRYYGGVDSTPLFLMLAGAFAQRTGDDRLIDELWPNLLAAMQWIDHRAGRNPHGLVDYARARRSGLRNQGWKDSEDSIFHADGRFPDGPIALVEVQGYVFAARLAMAALAERRGEQRLAQRWREQAEDLRQAVERHYWMDDRGFYAIALDGHDEPCRVLASNAGHLLYTRLPSGERATRVSEVLRSSAFDGGWGVRTLAYGEPNYNPMSYHNGSVWPHDTALCTAGMAFYGDKRAAAHLLGELFDAAAAFGARLPELYCGFRRRAGEPVVGYPVACLPQAWSSGAVFMVLQACLGVSIDAWTRTITVERPELPAALQRLVVHGLEIAGARVDLVFERIGDRVAVAPVKAIDASVQVVVRA